MKKFAYYYDKCDFKLIYGDSLEVLKSIKPESIDMIFADPPYFLSDKPPKRRSLLQNSARAS